MSEGLQAKLKVMPRFHVYLHYFDVHLLFNKMAAL